MDVFFGLDLTSSQAKASAYALLDSHLSVQELSYLGSDTHILEAARGAHTVAIDAPLSLPLGLDCLEETHPCQPVSPFKGRACERELAKRGIPCYFTTKKSIIKQMVYRGMALKSHLQAQGQRVIEIYPYATKVRLFPKPIPPKATPLGLSYLESHLATLIPHLPQELDHGLCDALLAAYTGYLHHLGETEPLGHPQEGLIFIPKEGLAFSRPL